MNIYWPGTKIPKSQGNAFTSWMTSPEPRPRKKVSIVQQKQRSGVLIDKNLNRKKSFTIYSRA
jgi:hypothetical protein